jgi:very-short-patch-repair endonuclease
VPKKIYDWSAIQADYDAGLSWRDIIAKYGVSNGAIAAARQRGEFLSRSRNEGLRLRVKLHGPTTPTHTPETREKISKKRIKFLQENPDKVPYRINHSSKESYPEKIFRNALTSAGITGWTPQYQNGIYCYDFAFVEHKIDVEIDGGTHQSDKVKRIDTRRDAWAVENGWKVIRFSADEVKLNVIDCINRLKSYL